MDEPNPLSAAVPQELSLHINGRISGEYSVEGLAGDQRLQLPRIAPVHGGPRNNRVLAKAGGNCNALYRQSLRIGLLRAGVALLGLVIQSGSRESHRDRDQPTRGSIGLETGSLRSHEQEGA